MKDLSEGFVRSRIVKWGWGEIWDLRVSKVVKVGQ